MGVHIIENLDCPVKTIKFLYNVVRENGTVFTSTEECLYGQLRNVTERTIFFHYVHLDVEQKYISRLEVTDYKKRRGGRRSAGRFGRLNLFEPKGNQFRPARETIDNGNCAFKTDVCAAEITKVFPPRILVFKDYSAFFMTAVESESERKTEKED